MNIYDYAMEIEKEGERFYSMEAARSVHRGMSRIFLMLARSKAEDALDLERMKKSQAAGEAGTKIGRGKTIFQKMEEEDAFLGLEVSEVEAYHSALEVERRVLGFWLQKVREAKGGAEKLVLGRAADMERKDCLALEELADFVSQPDRWLENAEWYHLDEY